MHHITASKDTTTGSHTKRTINDLDIALFIHLNTSGSRNDTVCRTRTDSQIDSIKFLYLLPIRRIQHTTAQASVLTFQESLYGRLPLKLHTFFHSILIFALNSRHLLLSLTIKHCHISTQTNSRTGSIHGHITATDNTHLLAITQRHHISCQSTLIVSIHIMEEVSTLTYTMQLASWSRIHILRHTRSCSHKDSIVSCTEKTVDSHIVLTYHAIGNKLHAQCLNLAHLITNHALWQAVFRNTIHQDTTRFSLTFKDGYIETLTGQITGNRQTSRTRTNDSHTTTSLLRKFLTRQLHLRIEISNKLLQFTNLYRFTLLA